MSLFPGQLASGVVTVTLSSCHHFAQSLVFKQQIYKREVKPLRALLELINIENRKLILSTVTRLTVTMSFRTVIITEVGTEIGMF